MKAKEQRKNMRNKENLQASEAHLFYIMIYSKCFMCQGQAEVHEEAKGKIKM